MNGATRRRDRDEDLALFRELFKRENERTVSLLDPVSEEFEPHASAALVAAVAQENNPPGKLASGKKESGYDFLAVDEKNDYDWLKTPPATPLFPSLEMEANDLATMFVHKELPILEPFKPSRLTGSVVKPPSGLRPRSPSSSSASSSRSVTPRSLLDSAVGTKRISGQPTATKGSFGYGDQATYLDKKPDFQVISSLKPASRRESLSACDVPKKLSSATYVSTKVPSRGQSPSPRIPAIVALAEETHLNLFASVPAAGRAMSRDRAVLRKVEAKPDMPARPRRLSCSPSIARGSESPSPDLGGLDMRMEVSGRFQSIVGTDEGAGSGGKRLEKMTSGRRTVERGSDKGPSADAVMTAGSGIGNMMGRNSLDVAFNKMDIKNEPGELQLPKPAAVTARNAKTPARIRGEGPQAAIPPTQGRGAMTSRRDNGRK